jgi:outer membrane immunogenic protein
LPTNPLLLYVTAGLAYGHTSTSASFIEQASLDPTFDAGATGSINAWRVGWTLGGGVEWMVAPRWSIKGEYLYYDLGSVTVNNTMIATNGFVPFFGVTTASEASYRGSIARGGISYHF